MVNLKPRRSRQSGATLVIALIILVLISLAVVSAFNLTSSNLRSVTNVQYRNEAIASANAGIEEVVGGSFLTALGSTNTKHIDVDKDGKSDYDVTVTIPSCPLRVRRVSVDAPSGYELGDGTSSLGGTYVADYELRATVTDTNTSASVAVREGVRVPLTETQYNSYVASCGLTLIITST